jgi:DNA-binding protein HU-beta
VFPPSRPMSELDPDWEDFMNRRELVNALSERIETDRRTAEEMVSSFVDIITDTVSRGEAVAISGFAKFARVDRAARMGRNPQTGEPIKIKASRKARITPLKAFKDAVLVGRRAPAKKAPAKKAAAKKTTARKAPAKKTAVKKTAARKTTAKKTTAKKTARRR